MSFHICIDKAVIADPKPTGDDIWELILELKRFLTTIIVFIIILWLGILSFSLSDIVLNIIFTEI
jgi:hypothetical protein